MSIGQEQLRMVLQQANDPIVNELKGRVTQDYLTKAASIAVRVGNICLHQSRDDKTIAAYMLDTFRAVLYKMFNEATGQSYDPTRHGSLMNTYNEVVNYINQNAHIGQQQQGLSGGLGGGSGLGGGGGVNISMPASTPGALSGSGVVIEGAGGVAIGGLPIDTPAAAPAVNPISESPLSVVPTAAPAVAVTPINPQPTRRGIGDMTADQLTGDTMERFEDHNLLIEPSDIPAPRALNRSITTFQATGNFADGLCESLKSVGRHAYEGTGIMVTMEDRARLYSITNPKLVFIAQMCGELMSVMEKSIRKVNETDDVEDAADILRDVLSAVEALPNKIVTQCRAMLMEEDCGVSLVEMSMVQSFIRKYRELLDLRIATVLHVMTVGGTKIPGLSKRVRWDEQFGDMTFLLTQIYPKAADDAGMITDADGFRNVFIATMYALRNIDVTFDDSGLSLHNRVATIWLPAHYASIAKEHCVNSVSFGVAQAALQTIFDTIVEEMPAVAVKIATPSDERVLAGAGAGTVIYYQL
jgi:hypothetical protein